MPRDSKISLFLIAYKERGIYFLIKRRPTILEDLFARYRGKEIYHLAFDHRNKMLVASTCDEHLYASRNGGNGCTTLSDTLPPILSAPASQV